MLYTTDALDRSTGEMVETSIGDWITVTELGTRYGVGIKQIRTILYHMGLLQPEGQHGRYRLSAHAVRRGLGKRIEKSRGVKWPFDVISPVGQQAVASGWGNAVDDLAREQADDQAQPIASARAALEHFQSTRAEQLETQGAVCWLADNFPALNQEQMASILLVAPPLVSRYMNVRKRQRDYGRWVKANPHRRDTETSKQEDAPSMPEAWQAFAELE